MTSFRSILLVEDDADARTIVREALEPQGFRVPSAGDGREALRRLETFAIDLVPLDLEAGEPRLGHR